MSFTDKNKQRLYHKWKDMRDRCYKETNKDYKKYGAKGIRVCSDWMIFSNFYGWAMATGWAPELTIDRIDPDGNYEPSNCQWLSMRENTINKRKYTDRPTKNKKLTKETVMYIHEHPEMSPTALARELGVNRRTVWNVRSGATWPELHPEFADKDSNEFIGQPCRKRLTWERRAYIDTV